MTHFTNPRIGRRGLLAGAGAVALGLSVPLAQAAPSAPAAPAVPVVVPDLQARIDRFIASRHLDHFVRPLHRAIDPTQYQCTPDDQMDAWTNATMARLNEEELTVVALTGLDVLPAVDAMLTTQVTSASYALTRHAHDLRKTFSKAQRFWDVDGSDIALMGMSTDIYRDVERMVQAYRFMEVDEATARQLAEFVKGYIAGSKGLEGGHFPLLSFNAFAYSTFGQEPGVVDRIVMGEGLLRAYDEIGFGDVAPQVVLAHEYGHHVQMKIGMITPESMEAATPEGTRRTELHADASAAYFCSHPKGLSMQAKRILAFGKVFHGIGDCQFDNPGHHGTPTQRHAAGMWGAEVQEATRPKSRVYPTRVFRDMFDAKLPELIAPDA